MTEPTDALTQTGSIDSPTRALVPAHASQEIAPSPKEPSVSDFERNCVEALFIHKRQSKAAAALGLDPPSYWRVLKAPHVRAFLEIRRSQVLQEAKLILDAHAADLVDSEVAIATGSQKADRQQLAALVDLNSRIIPRPSTGTHVTQETEIDFQRQRVRWRRTYETTEDPDKV